MKDVALLLNLPLISILMNSRAILVIVYMKKVLFQFVPLKESDLPLLCEWLNRSHLQKWWRRGKTNIHQVRKKYLPRIAKKDNARPFLAKLNGIPVGYIQYYFVSEGEENWWPDRPSCGVVGIDTFLADGDMLNKGIGTEMVSQFVDLLMKDTAVTEVRVDPHPDNIRAIRCYEKAGFKKIGPFKNPDGSAVMMILDRKNFLSS